SFNNISRWAPGATTGEIVAGFCCSGTGSITNPKDLQVSAGGTLYVLNSNSANKVVSYPVSAFSNSYVAASPGSYTLSTTSFSGCVSASNAIAVNSLPDVNLSGNL